MIKLSDHAIEELKIFIYPIPTEAKVELKEDNEVMRHFSIEKGFNDFIRTSSQVYKNEPSSSMKIKVTNDPMDANAFIIDHYTAKIYLTHSDNCSILYSQHLSPIVYNVIHNYPYFNFSRGADHFYIDTFDTGTICADMNVFFHGFLLTNPTCVESRRSIVDQIRNVSFIGNYGMDLATFKKGSQRFEIGRIVNMTGEVCHRPDKDIVIPQPTDPARTRAKASPHDHTKLVREFDSTFSGSIWGDRYLYTHSYSHIYIDILICIYTHTYTHICRMPLSGMAVKSTYEYMKNFTEDFGYDFNGGFRDLSLIHRGYYMYAPCGAACWSMRLYEALEFKTIPILVTDGPIQAFEKFIDWSKISVKISTKTWHDSDRLIAFRQKLRNSADELRNIHKLEADKLALAAHSEGIKGLECGQLGVKCEGKQLMRLNHELELNETARNNIKALEGTFIVKKIHAIENAISFFDYNDADSALRSKNKQPNVSAYKMILLEIWCRVAVLNVNNHFPRGAHAACYNNADYTSRMEYF